jgi:hypothetical protein
MCFRAVISNLNKKCLIKKNPGIELYPKILPRGTKKRRNRKQCLPLSKFKTNPGAKK